MDIKRKQYIDVAKGIAILLVIFSHTVTLNAWQEAVLASLHNSSFLVVSGMLFSLTRDKLERGETMAGNVFRKKCTRLIYPFVVWVLIYVFLELCMGYTLHGVVPSIRDAVLTNANRLWFLPVLFLSFGIVYIVWILKIDVKVTLAVWGLLIFISSLYSSAISKCVFFVFLVYLGTLCADIHFSNKVTLVWLCLYFVSAYFIGGHSQGGDIPFVYKRFLHYLLAVEGAFTVLCISDQVCLRVQKIRCLSAMGKDSIYFYVMHYIPIIFMEYMDAKNSIIKFCLAVIIPLLYIKFVKRTVADRYLFKGDRKKR